MKKSLKVAKTTRRIVLFAALLVMLLSMMTVSAAKRPKRVKSLKAKAISSSQIKLTWKRVKGASGYKVYNASTGVCIRKLKKASIRTCTISGLRANKKYRFKVRAYKKYKKKGKVRYRNGKLSKRATARTLKKKTQSAKAKRYTITVISGDHGKAMANHVDATAGETVHILAAPERGYLLQGWTTSPADINIVDDSFVMPASNVTITASFEEKDDLETRKWIVSFETNGGNDISRLLAVDGQRLDLPVPERAGYAFEGWYYDEAFESKCDASIIVSGDTTVYANWTARTTEIILKDDVGTGGSTGLQVTFADTKTTGGYTAPVNDTAFLVGWFADDVKILGANGQFAAAEIDGYISNGTWVYSAGETLTLTAKWTDARPIGGKIFWIDDAVEDTESGTFIFYRQDGTETEDPYEACFYKVTDRPENPVDKYYVVATDNYGEPVNVTGKTWSTDFVVMQTSDNGKHNTDMLLKKYTDEQIKENDSIWPWVVEMREAALNSCDDWYIGSKEELEHMRNAFEAFFNTHKIISSSEDHRTDGFYNKLYAEYSKKSGWIGSSKRDKDSTAILIRSF